MRKLKVWEAEAIEDLLKLGNAINAKHWQSGHARYKFKRRVPPRFARIWLRRQLEEENPTEEALEIFSDSSVRAVVGLLDPPAARTALEEYLSNEGE